MRADDGASGSAGDVAGLHPGLQHYLAGGGNPASGDSIPAPVALPPLSVSKALGAGRRSHRSLTRVCGAGPRLACIRRDRRPCQGGVVVTGKTLRVEQTRPLGAAAGCVSTGSSGHARASASRMWLLLVSRHAQSRARAELPTAPHDLAGQPLRRHPRRGRGCLPDAVAGARARGPWARGDVVEQHVEPSSQGGAKSSPCALRRRGIRHTIRGGARLRARRVAGEACEPAGLRPDARAARDRDDRVRSAATSRRDRRHAAAARGCRGLRPTRPATRHDARRRSAGTLA